MGFFTLILSVLLLVAGAIAMALYGRFSRTKEEMRQLSQDLGSAQDALQQVRQELSAERERSHTATQALSDANGRARQVTDELSAATERLQRYATIQNMEEATAKLRAIAATVDSEVTTLKQDATKLLEELTVLRKEQELYRLDSQTREFGLYEPTFSFDSSSKYKDALSENYARQKEMTQADQAAMCSATWTVDGDYKKGRKMTEQYLKLMLWAFNGECDALISQVKYHNAVKIEERVRKLFERINKLGQEKNCQISHEFLKLKLQELSLVHEYSEKRQQEAEEQRMLREQMRDEEKAQREIERAQQDAEREASRYQQALDKARKEAEKAHGEKLNTLQAEIERINQLLTEANTRRARAASQAELTKRGHVYVISNIGSFGEHIYKIGMTRRLEPLDRVDELGDASVPFRFDVHAMIRSDDAPQLERALQKAFEHRRVNLVNYRREFFAVTLDEIRKAVSQNHGEIEFTLVAEAEEYRKTQMMRKDGTIESRDSIRYQGT